MSKTNPNSIRDILGASAFSGRTKAANPAAQGRPGDNPQIVERAKPAMAEQPPMPQAPLRGLTPPGEAERIINATKAAGGFSKTGGFPATGPMQPTDEMKRGK